MPRRESPNAQTRWWIWLIIGVMMLFVPGGVFITPIMILLSIIMRKRKPKKNPQTSPSLITLI